MFLRVEITFTIGASVQGGAVKSLYLMGLLLALELQH
jgi:hypothetical protein